MTPTRFPWLLTVIGITAATPPSVRAGDSPEAVTLTTGDWANLSARYYTGDRGGRSPAVIILDDLGDDARPAACDAVARRLAKDGFTVLCFDFRGCGRSRSVEPDFWDDPNNRQLMKGSKADTLAETIRLAEFKPGYLPTLVNDVAAARSYLERRNDGMECNTNQIYLVGFGRGATLGQMWVAAEWARYRVSGSSGKRAARPEGKAVAGCVWVRPAHDLDRQVIPLPDLIKNLTAKRTAMVGLIHAAGDLAGEQFARQCVESSSTSSRGRWVASAVLPRSGAAMGDRDEVIEQAVKYVTEIRKVQESPPWDDHDFVNRRYVWAVAGSAVSIQAKDDGDENLQPIPISRILGLKK
ncbi:MAG: hypothetical protein ABGY75_10910 [Gemmataceae bacterium]